MSQPRFFKSHHSERGESASGAGHPFVPAGPWRTADGGRREHRRRHLSGHPGRDGRPSAGGDTPGIHALAGAPWKGAGNLEPQARPTGNATLPAPFQGATLCLAIPGVLPPANGLHPSGMAESDFLHPPGMAEFRRQRCARHRPRPRRDFCSVILGTGAAYPLVRFSPAQDDRRKGDAADPSTLRSNSPGRRAASGTPNQKQTVREPLGERSLPRSAR